MAWLPAILEALRSSKFRDLTGSRASTRLSVAEPLLNAIVAALLPRGAAMREVFVHPLAGDRLTIRVKLARPDFLPPFNATVAIERQPSLPDDATLRLRITGVAGLLAMAGPLLSIGPKLPAGVGLDGDLVTIDFRQLLVQRGQEDLLELVHRIAVHTEHGRVLLDVEGAVK